MNDWKNALRVTSLFAYPEHSLAYPYLAGFDYPWEALDGLGDFLLSLGQTLPACDYDHPAPDVWIAKTARIAPTASISGPCVICDGAELRPGAFLRGKILVGAGCVVGNSTELKNCVLFDGVQVPHFNYVGDSILGYRSHMGAGAVTSNVKSDKTPVSIRCGTEAIPTGRKKLGAMLGDFAEVGCNSVLNPGTVIGPRSNVYPLSSVRGFVPGEHIFKDREHIVPKQPN